jgi:hypothetical protein
MARQQGRGVLPNDLNEFEEARSEEDVSRDRPEEWCVEAQSPEEARELLASGRRISHEHRRLREPRH